MRDLLILISCAIASGAAPLSIRDFDWKNFSYPLVETETVPGDIRWLAPGIKESVLLANGRYVVPNDCGDERSCALVTFDSVNYGELAGIKSTAAAVALTYHSGGTANWQYVYVFTLVDSAKPRLLGWLRTGSRADQGLREVSLTDGQLVLVVNDPDKRQGDCCSAGTIVSRYRWAGRSFSEIGRPVYKTDPPSFDCAKATTPVELLICKDAELSFLDSQMANSYQMVLKDAPAERKEMIRRQQAEWFADYSRACNAALSDLQRRDCIDRNLSDRLMTVWK